MNGYYKAELVRGPAHSGPWKTIEQLELATLTWVHWHNTQRLHGYLVMFHRQSSKQRSMLKLTGQKSWPKSHKQSLH